MPERRADTRSAVSPNELVQQLSEQQRRRSPPRDWTENRRKAPKVSRACDKCKSRKARCSGSNPCQSCVKRGEACTWDARYSRGAPKTPPPATPASEIHTPMSRASADSTQLAENHNDVSQLHPVSPHHSNSDEHSHNQTPRLCDLPELESTHIRGQYYDLTSGLTFFHRASRRLSVRPNDSVSNTANISEKQQLLMNAGDQPIEGDLNAAWQNLPERQGAIELMGFYFDQCVVTYRLLHRPSVESWMGIVLNNIENGQQLHNVSGHAKAAAVITIFAIVTFRKAQIRGSRSIIAGDTFFLLAKTLTDQEIGLPRLESAQARILQVLYLLQTGRMNQAWYVFGNALQIISALGLHRKLHSTLDESPRTPGRDYIDLQCRKRTFWVAYTLDKYMCVVLGRPTHYHDNDIDQDYPDRINDDDMQTHGPITPAGLDDCYVDGLIAHAQLAKIIGGTSSEVYSIHQTPRDEMLAAAHRSSQRLDEWHRKLPVHLGAIKPSSLVPAFRRQSIALKLGYAHAIMHAKRPFMLGTDKYNNVTEVKQNITDCLFAAKDALQLVDRMAADGPLLYSLWWLHYVAFCALSVIYIWEIQSRMQDAVKVDDVSINCAAMLELADRCHVHLAQKTSISSPGRAYSVILEELRAEIRQHVPEGGSASAMPTISQRQDPNHVVSAPIQQLPGVATGLRDDTGMVDGSLDHLNYSTILNIWDGWQSTDWLDFDASAYLPLYDVDPHQTM